jgi:hypothetical protein
MDQTKQLLFRDSIKRMLVFWQLYKYALEDIRSSEYAKELTAKAKEEKNKNFQDIRVIATDQLNVMGAAMFKLKKTITNTTWNELMKELLSEDVHEISLLIDQITEMNAIDIEDITKQIKNWKQNGTKTVSIS